MKYQDICEKLKTGEFTFDLKGHRANTSQFLHFYEMTVDGANGASDGKWEVRKGETIESQNSIMRKHYQDKLDLNVLDGQPLMGLLGDSNYKCQGCGQNLYWVLDEAEKKLSLRFYFDLNNRVKGWPTDTLNPPEFVCPNSVFKPIKGEIKVNSTLIFANRFFLEDAPEEELYKMEYDLCADQGRRNITKYKAEKQNIAYGQMSNMSIAIYVHPDKKSIIIGDPYHAEHQWELQHEKDLGENPTDEECEAYEKLHPYPKEKDGVIDGHKYKGNISLATWRWEATDKKTLGKKGYDELVEKMKERCIDIVKVNVPHGIWEFVQYFDCDTNEGGDNPIYATLKLKE